MKQDYTDVTVVLDRSGSMASIKQDMEGGFAGFVEKQRTLPGQCLVSMVHFDGTATEVMYVAKPISEVGALGLEPRGNTPLLDATAFAINITGERLAALAEADRPANVLMLIVTDGQENASRHTTAAALKAMIEHQTSAYQWDFIYLGANVDAFAEGARMGIPAERAAAYEADGDGVRETWNVLSPKFAMYRGGKKDALDYVAEERKRMKKEKV